MDVFHANEVWLPSDWAIEDGEADLAFAWPNEMYGYEGLFIDQDGHCSRRRQIQSGNGPPTFVESLRDRVRLQFDAALAKKLDLSADVEIQFAPLDDDEFRRLLRAVECLSFKSKNPKR
jgi:hypothetical protein